MGSKLISGKFIQQDGEISNTKRKNLRILPYLDSLMLKIGVCEAKSSFGRIFVKRNNCLKRKEYLCLYRIQNNEMQ